MQCGEILFWRSKNVQQFAWFLNAKNSLSYCGNEQNKWIFNTILCIFAYSLGHILSGSSGEILFWRSFSLNTYCQNVILCNKISENVLIHIFPRKSGFLKIPSFHPRAPATILFWRSIPNLSNVKMWICAMPEVQNDWKCVNSFFWKSRSFPGISDFWKFPHFIPKALLQKKKLCITWNYVKISHPNLIWCKIKQGACRGFWANDMKSGRWKRFPTLLNIKFSKFQWMKFSIILYVTHKIFSL